MIQALSLMDPSYYLKLVNGIGKYEYQQIVPLEVILMLVLLVMNLLMDLLTIQPI